jgi:hypothetical protein
MFSPENVPFDTNVGNGVDGIYNQSLKLGTINQLGFQQNFNNIHNFPQGIEREVAQSVYINSPNVIIGVGRVGFTIVSGSTYTPKFGNKNGAVDEMYYDPCNMRAKIIVGIEFLEALVPEPFRSNLSIRGGHWITRFSIFGNFTATIGNLLRIIVVQNRAGVFLRQFELLLIEQDNVNVATTGVHRQLGWSNLPNEDIDNTLDTFSFQMVNAGANDFLIRRVIFEFEYEVPH